MLDNSNSLDKSLNEHKESSEIAKVINYRETRTMVEMGRTDKV